eukprot:1602178-Pyramimonas_sp.AAC.1
MIDKARSAVKAALYAAFENCHDVNLEVQYSLSPKTVCEGLFATSRFKPGGLVLVPLSPVIGVGEKVPTGAVEVDLRSSFEGLPCKMWIVPKLDLPAATNGGAKSKDPFLCPFFAAQPAKDSSIAN